MAEINKEISQGCPVSPTLFNTHLDEIITKWQKEDIIRIPLPKQSATVKTIKHLLMQCSEKTYPTGRSNGYHTA
jgi:hypothetical protein